MRQGPRTGALAHRRASLTLTLVYYSAAGWRPGIETEGCFALLPLKLGRLMQRHMPAPSARSPDRAPPLIRFHKPFRVLCQFSRAGEKACLADHIPVPDVYPAGRLDYDSEGLLLLTSDGRLAQRITDPRHKLPKTYLVQVEGRPEAAALAALRAGVCLKDGPTRPAEISAIDEPTLWPRQPPVRTRATIPTSWLRLVIREGRNRQVRRMCAHIGHPCLRLIRAAIGPWSITGLEPGAWCWETHPLNDPADARPRPARQRPPRHRDNGGRSRR